MYLLSVMSNGDKDVHGIAFSFNIFNTNVLLFCKTSLNNPLSNQLLCNKTCYDCENTQLLTDCRKAFNLVSVFPLYASPESWTV